MLAEVDGLLSKTVQAASLLIAPTNDVTVVAMLNELPTNPVNGGVMVERRLLRGRGAPPAPGATVPSMAALGLARIADLTLT